MMTGLMVLGGILLAVVAVVIVTYNGIIAGDNAVKRAWANVITQERQKNKVIPELESLTKQYSQFEEGLQQKITQLRTAVDRIHSDAEKVSADDLKNVELATQQLMSGLRVSVENYPELKASALFNNLMAEISEQQENISAAIRIYNGNIEHFNNSIESFPGFIINGLFNKKETLSTFNDTQAEGGFEHKPTF